MTPEEREQQEVDTTSRRQFLQRSAVVGAAVWAAPVISSVRMPAFALVSPDDFSHIVFRLFRDGDVPPGPANEWKQKDVIAVKYEDDGWANDGNSVQCPLPGTGQEGTDPEGTNLGTNGGTYIKATVDPSNVITFEVTSGPYRFVDDNQYRGLFQGGQNCLQGSNVFNQESPTKVVVTIPT